MKYRLNCTDPQFYNLIVAKLAVLHPDVAVPHIEDVLFDVDKETEEHHAAFFDEQWSYLIDLAVIRPLSVYGLTLLCGLRIRSFFKNTERMYTDKVEFSTLELERDYGITHEVFSKITV